MAKPINNIGIKTAYILLSEAEKLLEEQVAPPIIYGASPYPIIDYYHDYFPDFVIINRKKYVRLLL